MIGKGYLKGHQINGSLPLGNIIVHLTLPQLIPHFTNLHWRMDNFGFPYRIQLRFGTEDLETHQEGIPLVSCQSNRFQVGNVRVKVLGKLKSHKPQNLAKRTNKNLGINRYTLFDILNIIEYSPRENQIIKGVKKNNPCWGDKVQVQGQLGSKLGNPFGKLLRVKKDM